MICLGCGSPSTFGGTAVVVNVSNQAMLGSSIAEQGNVSDAVCQVVKGLTNPLYTLADRLVMSKSTQIYGFVSWHGAQSVTQPIWLW